MNRQLITLIAILILLLSCKQKESQKVEIIKDKPTSESKAETEKRIEKTVKTEKTKVIDILNSNSESEIVKFDQNLVEQLYSNLKSEFEIDFKLSHLSSVLNNIKISELENGKEFEKKMLFENFECECYDKIKISYSDHRFILWIYEEFYEKDLDWCPESSYIYSFKIENKKITDLKLDFMAG